MSLVGKAASIPADRLITFTKISPKVHRASGKLVDANYLNSVGWRGIRQRKANLKKVLRAVIEKLHAEGRPIRILDVAAGAGRYVLETMRVLPEIPMTVTLRDNKQENVDAACALATELGLKNVPYRVGGCVRSRGPHRAYTACHHRYRLGALRIVPVE